MNLRTIAAPAALAALLLACGPATSEVAEDKYYGPIDASALDARLRAATGARCPTGVTSCYPAQQVSLHGATITIYNMGTVAPAPASPTLTFAAGGTLAATFVTGAPYAYHFPDQCQPDFAYDAFADPYPNDRQFPVFSALPLTSTAVVLPIVRVTGVSGLTDNPCNALKKTASIEAGNFGAAPDDNKTAFQARLWAVIDPAALVVPLSSTSTLLPQFGWFKGLILAYLDGGRIPTNAAGAVLSMEGVVVDPAGTGSSTLTANKVIILPFGPDEALYSPIVRLRHFRAATGTQPGAYTALCTRATSTGGLPPCTGAPNEVDMSSASVLAPAETLIAVTSSN
ncbi:MAG TPA: hypothetical protein VND93_29865 [Myxococcales bacterium]|nr:hypothetical protein [Myxococcales bacterium]